MWYMTMPLATAGTPDDQHQNPEPDLDGRGVRVEEIHHLIGGDIRPGRRHDSGQCEEDDPERRVEGGDDPEHDPDVALARPGRKFGVDEFGVRRLGRGDRAAHCLATPSSTAWRWSADRSTKNITSTKSAKEPLRSQNDTAPSHANGPVLKIAAPTAGAIASCRGHGVVPDPARKHRVGSAIEVDRDRQQQVHRDEHADRRDEGDPRHVVQQHARAPDCGLAGTPQ